MTRAAVVTAGLTALVVVHIIDALVLSLMWPPAWAGWAYLACAAVSVLALVGGVGMTDLPAAAMLMVVAIVLLAGGGLVLAALTAVGSAQPGGVALPVPAAELAQSAYTAVAALVAILLAARRCRRFRIAGPVPA